MSSYDYVKHPKSGDVFACAIDNDGAIVRACGPVPFRDQRDCTPQSYFTRPMSDDDTADAQWLQAELDNA